MNFRTPFILGVIFWVATMSCSVLAGNIPPAANDAIGKVAKKMLPELEHVLASKKIPAGGMGVVGGIVAIGAIGLLIFKVGKRMAGRRETSADIKMPCGCEPSDSTECTLFSPKKAKPGYNFLVQVFMHASSDKERHSVKERAENADPLTSSRGYTSLDMDGVMLGECLTFELIFSTAVP